MHRICYAVNSIFKSGPLCYCIFHFRVPASVLPGAHCEILVFTVPPCDILKGETECAIRSEADVSGGGRFKDQASASCSPDCLSMLVLLPPHFGG